MCIRDRRTGELLNETLSAIQNGASPETEWGTYALRMQDVWQYSGIDPTTLSALKELYEPLYESVNQLNELKNTLAESGMEIPAALTEAISESADLGLIAGNRCV